VEVLERMGMDGTYSQRKTKEERESSEVRSKCWLAERGTRLAEGGLRKLKLWD